MTRSISWSRLGEKHEYANEANQTPYEGIDREDVKIFLKGKIAEIEVAFDAEEEDERYTDVDVLKDSFTCKNLLARKSMFCRDLHSL